MDPSLGSTVHIKDLAKAGCDRSHNRFKSGWEFPFNFLDTFVDQLAGKVNVRSVTENNRYLGKSIT